MTVECENCKTRFHVADSRIPAKGARVRCSRCHHRFHITPTSASSKQPTASSEGSALEPVLGGEAAREQDQLDNPEFLFDRPDAVQSKPARARNPRPEPEPGPDAAETQIDQPHLAEPPEPETPAPPAEERVVESGGLTAQEMLDDGEPELPTGRFEMGGLLGEPEIGTADDGNGASAGTSSRVIDLSGETSTPLAPTASTPPAFADVADIAAELGEDEDTSFADWDPLATPTAPASAGPAPVQPRPAKPAPGPANASLAVKAKRRATDDAPLFDPEAAGPAALFLRIAAVIIGLALLGAAGRLLWLQRNSAPPAPEIVQAAGWIAADLETFLARDASGERVIIVRGNLFPEGSAPPPLVEVRLLGADGQPLVESPQTWLERIDDAEVAPDRLAVRLAGAGGEIAAIGEMVTGFTAIIPDPPPNVRRVEVLLHSRQMAPEGTATAVAPAEPNTAPPNEAPAIESARPSSTALPSEPAPTDVVPAAPSPEP